MVTEATAMKIHGSVRDFFKGGIKSSNKRYIKENEKSERRNANQVKAAEKIAIYRESLKTGGAKGGSLSKWERAKKIHSLGSGASSYGNCTEMALLACYFAALEKIEYAVMCGFASETSDHAFCVVGLNGNPPWKCITDMNSWSGEGVWVIDPWAKICCKPQEYQVRFFQKMKYWQEKGKQIGVGGSWLEDQCSQGYLESFNRTPLNIAGVYIYSRIKDELNIS